MFVEQKSITFCRKVLRVPSYKEAIISLLESGPDEEERIRKLMAAIEKFYGEKEIQKEYPVSQWVRDVLEDRLERDVDYVLDGVRSYENDDQSFLEGCTIVLKPTYGVIGKMSSLFETLRHALRDLDKSTNDLKACFDMRLCVNDKFRDVEPGAPAVGALEMVLTRRSWPMTWTKVDAWWRR